MGTRLVGILLWQTMEENDDRTAADRLPAPSLCAQYTLNETCLIIVFNYIDVLWNSLFFPLWQCTMLDCLRECTYMLWCKYRDRK